jgi:hypothetical protein
MLSLIICSINPTLLERVKADVAESVGVEYELLVWDNRGENIGLCEVYNMMAANAKYPFLVFMHEDIIFEKKNWGLELLRIFENPEIGLIGVAGSTYKSRTLSGWYSGEPSFNYCHIKHLTNGEIHLLKYPAQWKQSENEVIIIDGVFMVARKSIWEKVPFNSALLKGFHLYDIDFSFRVSDVAKVVVTESIPMIHDTKGGDFGKKWLKEALLFHQATDHLLPKSIVPINSSDVETKTSNYKLDYLKKENLDFNDKLQFVRYKKLYLKPALWYGIIKLFVYKPLGLNIVHQWVKNLKAKLHGR